MYTYNRGLDGRYGAAVFHFNGEFPTLERLDGQLHLVVVATAMDRDDMYARLQTRSRW